MSLIFGAFVPHPPIILPTIGDSHLSEVEKTIAAMKELEGELYAMQPETIMIISPHSPIATSAFGLNLSPQFGSHLEDFGDFTTKLEFNCDTELISHIHEAADKKNLPVICYNQSALDHGVIVPLYYLTQHLPKIKIIPISFSMLDFSSHLAFGSLLRDVTLQTNKRIALIASGDLSHRLTEDAPAGYSPQGKTFDELIVRLLKEKKAEEILKINPELAEGAGECGFRSLLILLGALQNLEYKIYVHSYEGPFGVGYLVAQFELI